MSDAYDAAAVRHWSDAECLLGNRRCPNADQLFGLAAECAIKVGLLRARCTVPIEKRWRVHVNVLWDRARLQGIAKTSGALYALLKSDNPFSDWSIDQRYESGESIGTTAVDEHRKAARRALGAAGVLGRRAP